MMNRDGAAPLRVEDIPPGTCKIGFVGDKEVAIYNVGGEFYATQPHCAHAGGPLCEGALWGHIVTCPWHGSEFDVRTGEVTLDPADRPLVTYPVTVHDGMVIVTLREEAITETVPKEGFN
jgi:nitrite reductase/ring-hydroxylating ferredoxin subunit